LIPSREYPLDQQIIAIKKPITFRPWRIAERKTIR